MYQSPGEFERTFLPHTGRLLRFAVRLTGSTPSAEDLVQETLLRAWRASHQFRPDTDAGAWLFRILMNTFYAQHRKTRLAGLAVSLFENNSVATGASTLDRLEVRQAVQELPSEYRSVLMLAVVEGFTSREIADILAIPMGTVMSRLSRARQALRGKLAPETQLASALPRGKTYR